jgi:hypothetical protein
MYAAHSRSKLSAKQNRAIEANVDKVCAGITAATSHALSITARRRAK